MSIFIHSDWLIFPSPKLWNKEVDVVVRGGGRGRDDADRGKVPGCGGHSDEDFCSPCAVLFGMP